MATHCTKFCILSHRCLCVFYLILKNKTLFQGFMSSDVDAVLRQAIPDVSDKCCANSRDGMDCWPLNITRPWSFSASRSVNPTAQRLMKDPSAQQVRSENVNHRSRSCAEHVHHSDWHMCAVMCVMTSFDNKRAANDLTNYWHRRRNFINRPESICPVFTEFWLKRSLSLRPVATPWCIPCMLILNVSVNGAMSRLLKR
jgi:hypothetical protein